MNICSVWNKNAVLVALMYIIHFLKIRNNCRLKNRLVQFSALCWIKTVIAVTFKKQLDIKLI